MREPLGNKIFTTALFVICTTFITGWFLLFIELLLKKILLKQETNIELTLKNYMAHFGNPEIRCLNSDSLIGNAPSCWLVRMVITS
jgi:hypothetical protein